MSTGPGVDHDEMTDPIAALMGGTRAAVIQILADQELTTSELARAVGVSVASASHHASVLRVAGLLESKRDGQRMLHRLTVLGAALIDPNHERAHRNGAAPPISSVVGRGRWLSLVELFGAAWTFDRPSEPPDLQ